MSEYLRWNPGITLGIDEIDLEHQTFVVMVNQLEDYQHDPDMATLILRALIKYAAFHFQSEENVMYAAGYPDLNRHRTLHLDLMDHLNICLLYTSKTGKAQPQPGWPAFLWPRTFWPPTLRRWWLPLLLVATLSGLAVLLAHQFLSAAPAESRPAYRYLPGSAATAQ